MMDCQHIQELLSDYIDGLLPPRSAALVETHAGACAQCEQELRQLRQTVAVLRAVPPLTPPSYFAHAVQARIQESSRPRGLSLPAWLYPSRQGFAVRLAATAIMLMALIPPVRRPIVTGAWGLFGLDTAPVINVIQTSKSPTNAPPVRPVVRTESPYFNPSITAPQNAGLASGGGQDTGSHAVPAALTPISRPALPDASIRFKVDGQMAPGGIMVVTVSVTSRRDMLLDSAIETSLSPGAHFVSESGSRPGGAITAWSGNLVQGLPASTPVSFTASRAGLYDLRAVVRSGGREVGAADLLMPVGMAPASGGPDIAPTTPVSLYTALSTLSAQAARPIAVEEGLGGTRFVTLQDHTFRSALDTTVEEFGCTSIEQDGINYVLLHPGQ